MAARPDIFVANTNGRQKSEAFLGADRETALGLLNQIVSCERRYQNYNWPGNRDSKFRKEFILAGGTRGSLVKSAMTRINLQPTLRGELLELRPLQEADFEALYKAASDPLIWELHPQPDRHKREVFQRYFESAFASRGALLVVDRENSNIIGSSRYYDYSPERKQITIGYTFLSREYWGGRFNREMKRLMLNHAFGFAERVIFQIGEMNLRSRRAIEKIGARFVERQVLDGKAHVIYELMRPK